LSNKNGYSNLEFLLKSLKSFSEKFWNFLEKRSEISLSPFGVAFKTLYS
jgi:hypothetical protein